MMDSETNTNATKPKGMPMKLAKMSRRAMTQSVLALSVIAWKVVETAPIAVEMTTAS